MPASSSNQPIFVELADKKIADIAITSHAHSRWSDRVDKGQTDPEEVRHYLWDKLEKGRIASYQPDGHDEYVVDGDLLIVADFTEIKQETSLPRMPLYRMIIITFLGRISEIAELRDLSTYYNWSSHARHSH